MLAWLDFAVSLSWTAVWFWILAVVGVIWLRRHLELNRARQQRFLSAADADGVERLPPLTVLVAAKDEEANIACCLSGLLGQEYPDLQVVAIDDRSSDGTGAILDRIAAQDSRVTVVHIRELPAGWLGKSHALHVGMGHATGEHLCFVDADCQFHSPRLLAAAVRLASREHVDLLSVMPELEAHGFWERIVQPPAGGIMIFWHPPEKVNNPRKPQAYANGAFMLMTRPAYARLGGHAAVRGAMNEDMELARRAKALGVRLYVVPGGGMYTVRMYTGFGELWRGWTRIFCGSFGTWPRLILSAVFLVVFSLLPPFSLLASPLAGAAAGGIALAALFGLLVQQTVLWRFYRLCALPRHWALTFPLGAALCLAMVLNAMRRHAGAPLEWRGTIYRKRLGEVQGVQA